MVGPYLPRGIDHGDSIEVVRQESASEKNERVEAHGSRQELHENARSETKECEQRHESIHSQDSRKAHGQAGRS